jgi:hypothetical protein
MLAMDTFKSVLGLSAVPIKKYSLNPKADKQNWKPCA